MRLIILCGGSASVLGLLALAWGMAHAQKEKYD